MSYLGYKNKAFMNYKREQERIKMWKAEQARKLDITIMTPKMFKTKYNI